MDYSPVQEKIVSTLERGGKLMFRSNLGGNGNYLLIGHGTIDVPRAEVRELISFGIIAPGDVLKDPGWPSYLFEYLLAVPPRPEPEPEKKKRKQFGPRVLWSKLEEEILEKCYGWLPREQLQQLLPNRRWRSIVVKACFQGVKRIKRGPRQKNKTC